ncbi:MAG: RHS repeat-associated core domain-containing protein [Solirubrobacteraceae bacterium]
MSYSYDQGGELTSVTPTSGTGTSYSYDGTGELSSATAGSSTSQFAWNTLAAVPELLTDGSTNYIYGPDGEAVEQIASDGTVSYLHQDQIGTTRLITDSNGDAAGTFTYNPYGALSASTGTATTNIGYAGAYTDPTTGFQYDQARWYDPSTGQFLTVDPLVSNTEQPYDYAGDNPIANIDPTGDDFWSTVEQVTEAVVINAVGDEDGLGEAWDAEQIEADTASAVDDSTSAAAEDTAGDDDSSAADDDEPTCTASTDDPEFAGGRYGQLDTGNGIELHHMPADSVSPLSRGDGPAIQMERLDHYQTASWGGGVQRQPRTGVSRKPS